MQKLTLQISGLGPVPSFKNTKKIIRKKDGTPGLITDPKKRAWMDAATTQLELQLRGALPMRAGETHGEWQKRLRIAWWQLLDDSLTHQWPGPQNVVRVEKGKEGCEIVVELNL